MVVMAGVSQSISVSSEIRTPCFDFHPKKPPPTSLLGWPNPSLQPTPSIFFSQRSRTLPHHSCRCATESNDESFASVPRKAIDDVRYHDASKLVGWWVGCSKDSEDPFGRIIHISPGMGRFIAKSYSPRQLLTASTGTPIFEIFMVKSADGSYHMQVVYLRRTIGNSLSNPPSIPAKSPSTPEVKNASSVEVREHEEKAERYVEKNSNIEVTPEGIKSVINFLKENIPGLNVKHMNIHVEEESAEDKDSSKQLMEAKSNETIDGFVHNTEDTAPMDEFTRLPAKIKDMEMDSFPFHIPRRNLDYDRREDKVANIKVTALQGISELTPPVKVSSKVAKIIREILKQAQNKSRLSEDTCFSRITCSRGDFDPFDGLYVGEFGPYGLEIVQLRRKFGDWNDVDNENKPKDVKFFEYVEAVKLTGDLCVPAGQVTFRAKIGKVECNTNHGMYPDELGVVASYEGQGRIADFCFQSPKWVAGNLLQLNGKGMGPLMKDADLGFLYDVPEQSFLVLLNRLELPA